MLIVNFQIWVTLDDTHECSQGNSVTLLSGTHTSWHTMSEPVLRSQGVVGIKEFVVIRNSGKEFNFSNKVTRDKRYASIPPKVQSLSLLHCPGKDDDTQCPSWREELQKGNECTLYFNKFIASFSAHVLWVLNWLFWTITYFIHSIAQS